MLSFWLLFVCFQNHLNVAESASRQKRVIGGYFSTENEFPYIVSLRINKFGSNIHFCGGAIITERFIISSAHCMILHDRAVSRCFRSSFVQSSHYHIIAVVGTNTLNSNDGRTYNIANYIYHNGFDFDLGINDISLLQTTRNIIFNEKVQPIDIYTGKIPSGSFVIVSGWGFTSFPGKASNYLKYIDLRTISYDKCSSFWRTVYLSQICTFTRRGEGVCVSDSGGPLVYKNKLAGLVSFGKPCAIGFPDVFTNVSYFTRWIENNILCVSNLDL